MKKHFVLLLLSFAALCDALAGDFTIVKNSKITGAIIPAEIAQEWHKTIRGKRDASHGIQDMIGVEAQSFWTPLAKDIELAENRLRGALEKAVKEPMTLDAYAKTPLAQKVVFQHVENILKHYDEYRRQYIGLVIHGKRHIYLNSFSARDNENYTKQFVIVMDGGFWFWHILYSIDEGKFLSLEINGEA